MTGNYNTFWESKLSIIITMKRNQQHGSKSINNNLQTWPFEPTEESRMFPEKSVIYFPLDVSCLLQSAAMVAKKLLVGAKITACFKQIRFCMLLCKFRSEKHQLVKHFAFLKNFCCQYLKFCASSNFFYELWLVHNQLSWNVLLFFCNPIGQLYLGGPGYKSGTVRNKLHKTPK